MGAVLFVLVALASGITVYISPSCPLDLHAVIAKALNHGLLGVRISIRSIQSATQIGRVEDEIVLDYLYSHNLSLMLEGLATDSLYIKMWNNYQGVHLSSSSKLYADSFSAYVAAFNFTNVQLIANSESQNLEVAKYLYESHPLLYRDPITIPNEADIDFALQIVGRVIKPRGVNLIAMFTDPLSTFNLLSALETKKLNKAGYAYLLSQQASQYRYLAGDMSGLLSTGIVFIADKLAQANSDLQYQSNLLVKQLQLLLPYFDSSERLRTSEILRKPEIVCFCMNQSEPYIAAATASEVPSGLYLFPGDSATIPAFAIPKILTTVDYGVTEADMTVFPIASLMRGFQIAFLEVNNHSDLISNYFMEQHAVHYSGVVVMENYTTQAMAGDRKNLGLAFFCAPSAANVLTAFRAEKTLNLTLPIFAETTLTLLSDPHTFPLYLRIKESIKYEATIACLMMKSWGWTHIAVIYSIDDTMIDQYQQLLIAANEAGINITNTPDKRGLPSYLDSSTSAQVNATILDIMNSRTLIVVMIHFYFKIVEEQMYDLGIREKYEIVYFSGMEDSFFGEPQFYKRRVVNKGAIQFYTRFFVGPIGAHVHKELIKWDGNQTIKSNCQHYDLAYLYFHGINFLLEHGLDYEDPYELVKAMRMLYFEGCSGLVRIQEGSNDKVDGEIAITNFQYNSENDTYQIVEVGTYNLYRAQLYQSLRPIQWPNGNLTFPDLSPFYKNCTILAEVVQRNEASQYLGVGISFGVAVFGILASVILWKTSVTLPSLTEPQPISVDDVIVLASLGVEYFQYVSLGPDTSQISTILSGISSGLGFRIEKHVTWMNGFFLMLVDIVYGTIGSLVLLFILKLRGVQIVCKICGCLQYLVEVGIPVLANLLYIPIISTLLHVFQCYKSTSVRLSDAFLNSDCSVVCWSGTHLGYVIGSGVALLVYIPFAIFTRSSWQNFQESLHVRYQPHALLIKSMVQLVLIASSVSLRENYSAVQASLFIVVLSLYIVYAVKFEQLNYGRANLWVMLILVAVLIQAIMAYISLHVAEEYQSVLLGILTSATIVLGVIGAVLQKVVKKFQSKLTRAKAKDLNDLFIFAFTCGKRAQLGLQAYREANSPPVQIETTGQIHTLVS